MASARYIIGIDLGTTNAAVSYVDTRSADQRVQVFDVPQLVAPAELAERKQLPSFLYLPGEHDLSPAETALPWDERRRLVVGELARAQGARVASRMIASAKSWLCHSAVDRSAAILPWGAEDDVTKMSPVTASAMMLRHIQEAWNEKHEDRNDADFEDQDVMVTVPASFDEAARELTMAAAEAAGLGDIVLLEEPQAAFYAWIESNPASQRKALLAPGNTILVFDIGGGTTDFTLINVAEDGESFERTAVGDHLLLGGDNIDLTLALKVEKRLQANGAKKLGTLQWQSLVHTCRLAKERLLGDNELDSIPISVAGSGSKLIGKSLKEDLSRHELLHILDEGFFPEVDAAAIPNKARSGLQQFGLPYAADAAITKHLASFLARHDASKVDAILFNGGAMTPESLRKRVLGQIAAWQNGAPKELSNVLPELAVAKGAAYYGLVRRGLGARICGGTARSYYVGVESEKDEKGERNFMAVCLAGKGLEEGSCISLERDFELVCNRPVRFKLFSSSTRQDEPGTLAPVGDGLADSTDDDSDLLELPPIVTVLRAPGRSKTTVRLEITVTELGSLEIWCVEPKEGGERWRLSFDLRAGGSAKEEEPAELDPRVAPAKELLRACFRGESDVKPAQLLKRLEKLLESRRDEWSMSTARALFDATLEVEDCRKRSADHEARWLNLCGFCLRPGKGAPLDDWRITQMWRVFNQGMVHEKQEACRLAWWILWRRISGGMAKGQQEQIYDRLALLFLPNRNQRKRWHQSKPTKQVAEEMWRTLANLERVGAKNKAKLGDELVRRLDSKKQRDEAIHFWALGRLGTRAPLYGPLDAVVAPARVQQWLDAVLAYEWPNAEKVAFPMAQLGRKTGDRGRDVDEVTREKLAARLRTEPGGERMARLVEEIVELEAREERVALGDTLPAGLRLVPDQAEPPRD
ncbi:MAG: hsp70 family protein [Myxococcales bacterium]|nr:hsp70 family protein [Myxococcales bacterium]